MTTRPVSGCRAAHDHGVEPFIDFLDLVEIARVIGIERIIE